jgi:hypothetical protein
MALSIDTSLAVRSLTQQRSLVEAIRDGDAVDETDWVEWKSWLDLSTPAGRFAVGRQILGFGNRDPRTASTHFEGTAYVVVGVEPGSIQGTSSIDAAELARPINAYVGEDGPVWSSANIAVDGHNIVIFTVEAPQPGNRIFTLRKEFNPHAGSREERGQVYPVGTIFVRNGTITAPATPTQIRMLEDRFVAGTRPAAVVAEAGWAADKIPVVAWIDVSAVTVEALTASERARLLAAIADEERAERGPRGFNRMIASSFIGAQTLDGFRRDVDEYLAEFHGAIPDALRTLIIDSEHCKARLTITNPTDQTLVSARLLINVPAPIEVHDGSVGAILPERPTPVGVYKSPLVNVTPYLGGRAPSPHAGQAAATDAGTTVLFQLGDLHPYSTITVGDDISLILTEDSPPSSQLTTIWQVTASNRADRAVGRLPALAFAARRITPVELVTRRG